MEMGSASFESRDLVEQGASAIAFHEKALSLRTAIVKPRSPLPIAFFVSANHSGNETGFRTED
jgi:hypothetical protein